MLAVMAPRRRAAAARAPTPQRTGEPPRALTGERYKPGADRGASPGARSGGDRGVAPEVHRRAPDPGLDPARQTAREASFLAEASRLLANSLDYETTLSTVAGLALPDLGAWCIVDIVEANGDIRRLAIVHPEDDKQALVTELREGWPPTRHDRLGVPIVARSLQPEIVPHVDQELLEHVARNPRNLEILLRLGIGSLMSVPLSARGDCLGAITFVSDLEGRSFNEDDLALAEDLANRAAIAIDNARLYRQARRSREAAEMASRAKSQFLGVMSHELRTPINAILGYTQILDMGVKGKLTDEQRALLSRIDVSGKHLLELVTRVLDVSRAEAGELTVSNHSNIVHDVIESTLQIVSQQAPEHVRVETRCDGEGDFRFLGDGIRVRQILVQLVSNAFRFTREDGRVIIECQRVEDPPRGGAPIGAGPWIRIDVHDEGIGIPEDRIDAVFEPFVQAETNSFTRETDGSGLGLAIGRYLARLMGGDLTVVSEAGKGSTFSLWLAAPRKIDDSRRDRRVFDRQIEGLPILADHLLRRLKPIVDAYVDRLRQDGGIPRAGEATDIELRDHIPHFIAGLSDLLRHAGSVGQDVSQVLRGGTAIQRTTLELHGAQRHQLGWTTGALRRDLDLLRRVIRHDIRSTAPQGLKSDDPFEVLDRLFEQAQHISLQGWKHADRSGHDTLPHTQSGPAHSQSDPAYSQSDP